MPFRSWLPLPRPGLISICEEHGLARSMPKKGCPPDDSAREGFFGRMKNEMFHGEKRAGCSVDTLIDEAGDCIRWRNEHRIKQSPCGRSPLE